MNKAPISLRTGSKVLHKGDVWLVDAVPTHHCAIHRLQDGRNGGFSIPPCQLTEPVGEKLHEV
jgi:hypothetical protein